MRYRAPRHPTDTAIVVTTRDGPAHGTLRNVSNDGMCIAGLDDVSYGDRLFVPLTGKAVTGRVVWSNGKVAGMRLDRRLNDAEICFLRKVPDAGGMHGHGPGRAYTEL